jgi:hypothetical protein
VARRGTEYKLDEKSCAAILKRTAIDGTVNDLSEDLLGVKGKIVPPPDKISSWRMNLKVSFSLDNGATIPNPALRGTYPGGDGR